MHKCIIIIIIIYYTRYCTRGERVLSDLGLSWRYDAVTTHNIVFYYYLCRFYARAFFKYKNNNMWVGD